MPSAKQAEHWVLALQALAVRFICLAQPTLRFPIPSAPLASHWAFKGSFVVGAERKWNPSGCFAQPQVCTEQPMVAPPTRFASEGAIRGKGLLCINNKWDRRLLVRGGIATRSCSVKICRYLVQPTEEIYSYTFSYNRCTCYRTTLLMTN